ncbi:HAD family phosphatase [Occallatibacter riparius]|uniref:HAD family phosphatase n=1 Tax=Occallatibacter riparius TaxID=1002689 RepID=A0A9J7BWF7_9BACT|nr:HAD family phosphatase [Occallatibacter riparius]
MLADTETLYWRAWCELLKPCNVEFTWADYCRIGRGIREERMLESLALMVSDTDAMHGIRQRVPEAREMVRRWKLAELPITEATIDLLKSLAGWILGLVTSSDRSDVEPLLLRAGIAHCFTACVFGDETTTHKPDPAPYLMMREKLGVSDGVVFEDSDAGFESAAAAGFDVIRVETPGQLPALVRKLLKWECTEQAG